VTGAPGAIGEMFGIGEMAGAALMETSEVRTTPVLRVRSSVLLRPPIDAKKTASAQAT
jgi:hypothetical protein